MIISLLLSMITMFILQYIDVINFSINWIHFIKCGIIDMNMKPRT